MLTRITTLVTAALLTTSVVAQDLPPDLPPADELIANALRAAGGRDALESIETLAFNAEMMGENGAIGLISCVVAPDGRGSFKGSAMQGQVTYEFGFDDKVGWLREPPGNEWRLQSSKEMMTLRFWVANQFLILHLDEWFETRETVERGQFKGKDAYRVRLEDDDHKILDEGEPRFAWFDAESGLLIGIADEAEMSDGIAFEDYKSAGPFKVARTVRIEIAGYMMLKISDVTIDEADAGRLDPPAKVQKMIDAADDDES